MTDKEQNNGIKYILRYFSEAESSLECARSEIEDLINTLKVSDEVENFIWELQDNEQIPEEIRNKAGELWKKI